MPSDATTPRPLTVEEVAIIEDLYTGAATRPNRSFVLRLIADWRRLTAEVEQLSAERDECRRSYIAQTADYRAERVRSERAEAANMALRKVLPDADLLFNAAYLMRATWDDKCVAMAGSLERAAAGILALAADDDARADALIELVRRA